MEQPAEKYATRIRRVSKSGNGRVDYRSFFQASDLYRFVVRERTLTSRYQIAHDASAEPRLRIGGNGNDADLLGLFGEHCISCWKFPTEQVFGCHHLPIFGRWSDFKEQVRHTGGRKSFELIEQNVERTRVGVPTLAT